MTIKTFICVVCGDNVTKPKSYAVPEKNGRACRHHEEAQQAFTEGQVKAKEQTEKSMNGRFSLKDTHAFKGDFTKNPFQGFRDPKTYCWCCKKDGVDASIVALRVLTNISKSKLQGEQFNPFDYNTPVYENVRNELDLKDKVVIKCFGVPKDYPEWKLKQILNSGSNSLLDIVLLVRIMYLCQSCALDYEFDFNSVPSNLSLDEMVHTGAMIEPIFDEIAKEELTAKRH